MNDLISRQAAIDMFQNLAYDDWNQGVSTTWANAFAESADMIKGLPSAQPEQHYCRECKWSSCHINVDKYGKSETYWWCINWGAATDEEGYCHEWKRRTDG